LIGPNRADPCRGKTGPGHGAVGCRFRSSRQASLHRDRKWSLDL